MCAMNNMKIIITLTALCLVATLAIGCRSGAGTAETTEYQVVDVQRGNLTLDVIATGNLVFSDQAELAFQDSGTVGEVLVEVGDSVEEGQLLAKLDISEWQDRIDALEYSVTAAEDKLTATERSLTLTERKPAIAQINLLQAEINLKTAQIACDMAEDNAWTTDEELEVKELQVQLSEMLLVEAQQDLLDADRDITDAQQAVTDARQAVTDAQYELYEAESVNRNITTPRAGLITAVYISAGDIVKKGRTAIVLTDPDQFEARILVNEIDILKMQVGATAAVELESLHGINLPAQVSYIAAAAGIQAGVVNYQVTVTLEPPTAQEPGSLLLEDVQLREGLSVTVSVIIQERNNVLFVPNQAIILQDNLTSVRVIKDGNIEERLVQTGLSGWRYTEIIEGLDEDEQVVVSQTTGAPSSTTQQNQQFRLFQGAGR